MTNPTEIDVAAALDGDRDALTRLVERVRPPVSRLALRFFGNPADAEDATQEALIQIVTRLDRFSGAHGVWLDRDDVAGADLADVLPPDLHEALA